MKKEKKTPQSTIADAKVSNKTKPSYMIDFRHQLGLDRDTRLKPKHYQFLADLLEQWIDNDPNAIDLKTFRRWHHLTDYPVFTEIMKRDKYLEEALKYAKLSIAENRERLALFKEIEPKVFAFMQHNYDPEWGKSEERQANLRKEQEKDNTTKIIVLEKYKDEIEAEKKV